MAGRGPIPKRAEELLGHRRKSRAEETTTADGAAVVEQPAADPGWCPQAVALWESLGQSGQARWYEPADWSELAVLMWFWTSKVNAGRATGDDLKAMHQVLSDHLVSEGARRRVRVELRRPAPGQPEPDELPEGVTPLERRRAILGGGVS